MLIDKTVQKLIFIVSGIVIFYSQIMLWQNYLVEKIGERPELNFMDAQYHLQRGIDSAYEGEFQKAIKLDPTNPDTYYKLANYYASVSGGAKLNQACEEYKKALFYSTSEQQSKILEEIYAKVTQDYLFLKKIIPNTDTARHSFAGFLRDKKLYEDAILEYGQLIKDTSSNYILTDSYNWIAIIYLWQGKFDETMEYFNKAVGIAKDNKYKSWIFRNLGNMYLEKGDAQKAKETYKQAIKTDPAHWANYYGIGYVCEKMGSQREAANYYRKALQLGPGDYKPRILKRLEQLGR